MFKKILQSFCGAYLLASTGVSALHSMAYVSNGGVSHRISHGVSGGISGHEISGHEISGHEISGHVISGQQFSGQGISGHISGSGGGFISAGVSGFSLHSLSFSLHSNAPIAAPTPAPTTRAPTTSPTRSPTPVPTVRPTAAVEVTFLATQQIDGINVTQYQAQQSINDLTIEQAVATSVGFGVTSSDVTITLVTAGSRRRLQAQPDVSSGETSVSYIVQADTTGFSSANAAFTALTNALTTAVNNGNFTKSMNEYAVQNGAAILATATSNSISVTSLMPTFSPTSAPANDKLSGGAIAGIVIACVVGASSMIFAAFYCIGRKTIVVAGLPPSFETQALMVSLPGAVAVRRMDNMVCAFVDFETHAMAQDLIDRSQKELIYFQNSTLTVRWAMPSLCESMCGGSGSPASNQGVTHADTQPRYHGTNPHHVVPQTDRGSSPSGRLTQSKGGASEQGRTSDFGLGAMDDSNM